jgi:hypothetical protein
MKRGIVITCLIGLATATATLAQETNTPPPIPPAHRPMGSMMDIHVHRPCISGRSTTGRVLADCCCGKNPLDF